MLYLNRKPGEAVIINHCIEVRVVEIRGRTVKLGLTFPPEATEVFEAIKEANRAALDAVRALPVGDRAPGAADPSAGDHAALDRG